MLITISNLIEKTLHRSRSQGGFSMIPAITSIGIGTTLSLAAWQATHADVGLQDKDRWSKRAYQAAQVGASDFAQHLAADSNYWSYCDDTSRTNAVNDTDTATRRWWPLPGGSGNQTDQTLTFQYTIDAIPANGYTRCKAATDRTLTMVDASSGVFRMRITGRAGPPIPNTATIAPDPAAPANYVTNNAANRETWRQKRWKKRSVVIDYRRRGFLDFAWFTDIEGQDPDLQTFSNPSSPPPCDEYWRDSRGNNSVASECSEILFAAGDEINGPFHTNDGVLLTTNTPRPIFGSVASDRVEVSDGSCPFRTNAKRTSSTTCTVGNPNIVGTRITGANAPVLQLPEANEDLETYGETTYGGYNYSGITRITLNAGGTMTIVNNGVTQTNIAYPTSGVIYVRDVEGVPCVGFDVDDPYNTNGVAGAAGAPSGPGCGTVEIGGTYNTSLTVAAENDIVITSNLARASGSTAVLGLIANKYVRLRHFTRSITVSGNTRFDRNECQNDTGTEPTSIQAAMMALTHSILVDQWQCGASLGTLTVNGVLAQKYRGAVGTGGGNGYIKDYNYDTAFRAQTPPYFLTPSLSGWRTSRYREQVPACTCT